MISYAGRRHSVPGYHQSVPLGRLRLTRVGSSLGYVPMVLRAGNPQPAKPPNRQTANSQLVARSSQLVAPDLILNSKS
jgi:hypothetical protein